MLQAADRIAAPDSDGRQALDAGYTFRVNQAVDVTLPPQGQGGVEPFTYRLTVGAQSKYEDAAFSAPGLTFDSASRIISGTPSTSLATQSLVYHLRDRYGVGVEYATEVTIVPALRLDGFEYRIARAQTNIDLTLPDAQNVFGAPNYSLTRITCCSGLLPEGLTYDAASRRLTGAAPDSHEAVDYQYSVTDAFDGAVAVATFKLRIITPPPILAPSGISATYTVGTPTYTINGVQSAAPLSVTRTPNPDNDYYIYKNVGELPGGMSRSNIGFNQIAIQGTPNQIGAFTFLRITDNPYPGLYEFRSVTFTLTIDVEAPPNYADAVGPELHATVGHPAGAQLPAPSGGAVGLSYRVNPPFANAGITINPLDAVLLIAPTEFTSSGDSETTERTEYELIAADANGVDTSLTFGLQLYAPIAFAAGNQPPPQTYAQDVAFTASPPFLAAVAGRLPYTYSLSGGQAARLSVNQLNRTIGGVFENFGEHRLEFTATDANGATAHHVFTAVVTPSALSFTPDALAFARGMSYGATGEPIGFLFRVDQPFELTLPRAEGGVTPVTYSETADFADVDYDSIVSGALPGSSVDLDTLIWRGTPTSPVFLDNTMLLWARDSSGAQVTYHITQRLANPLKLPTQLDLVFTVQQPLEVQLPQDAPNTWLNFLSLDDDAPTPGAPTYQLAPLGGGDLPDGLTLDAASGRLSGIAPATPVALTQYEYRLTDVDGATDAITFAISILDAPRFPDGAPQGATFTATHPQNYTLPIALVDDGAAITYAATWADADWLSKTPSDAQTTSQLILRSEALQSQAEVLVTYTASSGGETNTVILRFMVAPAPYLDLLAYNDDEFEINAEVDYQLPVADGGVPPYSYELTSALPPGLRLAPGDNSRQIVGTPSEIGRWPLTMVNTDSNGAAIIRAVSFVIHPTAPRFYAGAVPPATYSTTTPAAITLPVLEYTGINLPLALQLELRVDDDDAGAMQLRLGQDGFGLTFSQVDTTNTYTLSGTPSAAGQYRVIYDARPRNADPANAPAAQTTFGFTALTPLSIADQPDITFTTGHLSTYTLNAAVGGVNPTYQLERMDAAAPSGLTLFVTAGQLRLANTVDFGVGAVHQHRIAVSDEIGASIVGNYFAVQQIAAPTYTTTLDALTFTAGVAMAYTLPPPSDGGAPFSYSIARDGGAAVPGQFTFDADQRILSTDTEATGVASGNLGDWILSAADVNNAIASATFAVIVEAFPQFDSAAQAFFEPRLYFRIDTEAALTLPEVVGGAAPISYRVTGDADWQSAVAPFQGFTFDPTTRAISGSEAAVREQDGLYYHARDRHLATTSYAFSYVIGLPLSLPMPDDLELPTNQELPGAQLPQAINQLTPLNTTYTLTGLDGAALPSGLTFDGAQNVRELSGTAPSVAIAPMTLVYGATDLNDGGVATASFTLQIAARPRIIGGLPTDITYTAGQPQANTPLPLAEIGGGAAITYQLTGVDAADWLSRLPNTAQSTAQIYLVAAPTQVESAVPLTYTATSGGSVTTAVFNVSAVEAMQFAVATPLSLVLNEPIDAESPLPFALPSGGVAPFTYAFLGLPAGIAQNGDTNTVLGTPSRVLIGIDAHTTFRVTDVNGATADNIVTFNIYADAPRFLSLPPSLSKHTVSATFTPALTLPPVNPYGLAVPTQHSIRLSVDGQGEHTIEVGETTFGLSIAQLESTATYLLSGAPNTIGTYAALYSVSDDNAGIGEYAFTFVAGAAPRFAAQSDLSFTATHPSTFTLALAQDGIAPLVYALEQGDGSAISAQWEFDADTRQLRSLSTTTKDDAGFFALSVRDINHAAAGVSFRVDVVDAPRFAAIDLAPLIVGFSFRIGTSVDLTLPAAIGGGVGPLTYRLRNGQDPGYFGAAFSVAGLAYDPAARVLSGTPTTPYDGYFTHYLRDANGAILSQSAPLFISAPLSIGVQSDIELLTGNTINIQLPRAQGVIGTLLYTLADTNGDQRLPGEMTFDNTRQRLVGMATAPAATKTYVLSTTDYFDNDQATSTFTLGVFDKPSFVPSDITATYTVGASTYTIGGAQFGDELTLPFADGASAAGIRYAVARADLPSGLTRRALGGDTIGIRGAPTQSGLFTFLRTAADIGFPAREGTFTLIINSAAALQFDPPSQPKIHATVDGNFLGVQLPSATGGGVALSYAITPPIASGVNVNFETLRLFGVADANADLGNTRHTLRVTDVNGASASLQFDLQVYDRFGFAAGVNPSAATYTVGAARKPVTFLAARGGRGPYDYSIAIDQIDAPNNLTFDASARELSGMFLGATEPVSIAYRATDANGAMVQHLVELAVIEAPLFSPADLTELSRGYSFRVNVAAQVTLPEVDLGAAPFTYRLTDGADSGYEAAQFALSGLNFDAAARILSGAPAQAYGGAVEYHARDSKASYTSATTDIRAFGALSLSQSDISLAVGKNEMVALNAALNVVGAASYTLTDLVGDDLTNLPGGIAFNPSTRTLSGVAPNSPVDPLTFVYTVHDDYDSSSASASFAISVDAKPSFNPLQIFATYTVNNAAYSSGGARAPGNLTLPRANVGPTLSYALEGAIPDGMTRTRIADDELVLTGLPTRAAAFTFRRIAIDVDNPQQRGTFTLISVVAPTPTFGAQTVDKLHATIGGNEIDETMPMASGGAGALVYSIVRAVPSGLTFDADTRELTGVAAADAVTGNVARAYNAVDINGVTASLLFDMQVYAALRFVESIQPQAVTYSLATDKTLTFSAVAGGRAPIQYALEVAAIGASNDLTFDATTRLLSGGYLGGSAAVDLTYIATDANGARREHPFSVAAVDAPQFDPVDIAALVVGYTFRVGATIDATLPSAVDGVTPLTHRLTRGVDSDYDAAQFAGGGVAFDSATRILSGAATIAFDDAVEYHVRDANGAGASTPATIRILSSLTLEQPDVNLSGAAGVNVQLARVRNAVGAIVYTLTDLDGVGLDDLPSGVTFDAVAQRLGGIAPGAAITQSFIYTATDDFDANSVSVTFAVSVVDKPTFSPTSLSVTYTANNATYVRNDALISDSLTLPMADGAVGQLSYAVIESNLPNGVSQTALANDTVVISGAPTETGAFTFTRIAADSGGVEPGTFTLLMEVTALMLDPIANGQSGLPALYHATIAGPDLDADLGTWRCQIGCYYEMSVQLPPGLVHWSDAATGENRLRGSPTAGVGVGNYGVRGGDLWGESIFPFTLQVYPQLTFAPGNPSAVRSTASARKMRKPSPSPAAGARRCNTHSMSAA